MTDIIQSYIKPYSSKSGFSYQTDDVDIPTLNIFLKRLHMVYTDAGVKIHHNIGINTNGTPVGFTGLTERITDHNTGEILYEFYGDGGRYFQEALDDLIKKGRKFDVSIWDGTGYHDATYLLHKYRQLKSGKWRA